MFKKVHLAFFGKHEDLTVEFTEGLNVIRAANEQGKSTLLRAIAYAMFGAKALKETLEETVTYDHKVTELKVTLDLRIAGIDLNIRRGKSGAECVAGSQRITGQNEVTKYVESLLGSSADTAFKLMLAKQSSVSGALSEGPSGPVSLIETLADFDLITSLVDLVQNKLPSGSTRVVEDQITRLSEAAAEQILDTTANTRQGISAVESSLVVHKMEEQQAKNDVVDHAPLVAQLADARNTRTKRNSLVSQLFAAAGKVESCVIPPDGDDAKIATYSKEWQEVKLRLEADKVRKALADLGPVNYAFKTAEEHEADKLALGFRLKKLYDESQTVQMQIGGLSAKLITETACGLCGKDLTDVPEVVEKNRVTQEALNKAKAQLAQIATDIQEALQEETRLQAISKDDIRCKIVYATAGDYIKLKPSTVPAGYEWVGPPPLGTDGQPDYAALIRAENDRKVAHAAKTAERAQLVAQHTSLCRQLEAVPEITDEHLASLQEEITKAEKTQAAYREARDKSLAIDRTLVALQATLSQELAVMAEAQKRVDGARVQLAEAAANLKEQNSNNILISKMRAARPVIADKLWTIVLSTVSSYFSSVRGEITTITRTDNGFRANGRPVSGLSGSTQDALGLSIRVALTKTFLPNASFLILDEVAAGMDDTRETAMLGLIASCGMEQVILVTHSPLADAFAVNIITL